MEPGRQFRRTDLHDVYSSEYDTTIGDLVGSAHLQSLTDDIRAHGVQEPIHLHAHDEGWRTRYSMSDGHHRAVSAIHARVPYVPVVIHGAG